MDYAALITHYGYIATFVGTLLEGETLLVLSGVAAHHGYLALPIVVLVGAIGATIGDLVFFLVGRHYGARLFERFPRFRPAAHRVHALIERHPAIAVIAVRFMWGARTAGPAVIGTTRLPLSTFVVFNVVGAALWSTTWAGAGWAFGRAADRALGNVVRGERDLFIGLVVAIVLVAGALHLRRLHARRQGSSAGE